MPLRATGFDPVRRHGTTLQNRGMDDPWGWAIAIDCVEPEDLPIWRSADNSVRVRTGGRKNLPQSKPYDSDRRLRCTGSFATKGRLLRTT
jgi:hypothetical protein